MSNIRSITFAEYEKCIHKIESLLLEAGVRSILKSYDQTGFLESISFTIKDNNYKIAYDSEKALNKTVNKNTNANLIKTQVNTNRYVWKLLVNLLTAQVRLIKLDQLDLTEAFISFMEVTSKGKKSIVSPLKDSNNG